MPLNGFWELFGIVGCVTVALIVFELIVVCISAGKNGFGKYLFLYLPVSILGGLFCTYIYLTTTNGSIIGTYFIVETTLSLFSIMLFPGEFRRVFSVKDKRNVAETRKGDKKPEVEQCITSVIKALQNMSKNDIGALVVLANGNLPKQVIDSGTRVNADISSQMIEALFYPKAPLHDGAVILEGHRISAAGCFLPLTNNLNYPKELGTRHRAAIGITEVANVTAIVVSEETGIISFVKQGKVTRYADYDMLRKLLEEYYWKDLSVDKK